MQTYKIDRETSSKITIISFLLMCMVVFIHSQCYQPLPSAHSPQRQMLLLTYLQLMISEGICRIAVPFFFLIAGVLFCKDFTNENGWFISKISSRVRTLVIPYLLWGVGNFLLIFVAQNTRWTAGYFGSRHIVTMRMTQILETLFWRPYCYQFWFVRDLFIFILFSRLLIPLMNRWPILYFCILGTAWLSGLTVNQTVLSIEGLLFFSIGNFIAMRGIVLPRPQSDSWALVFIGLWIAGCLIRAVMAVTLESDANIPHKLNMIIGIIALWLLVDVNRGFWEKNRNRAVYQYSFFVFAFHQPMITVFNNIMLALVHNNQTLRIVQYIVLPIVVIGISIVAGAALQALFPRVYAVMCGNRTRKKIKHKDEEQSLAQESRPEPLLQSSQSL